MVREASAMDMGWTVFHRLSSNGAARTAVPECLQNSGRSWRLPALAHREHPQRAFFPAKEPFLVPIWSTLQQRSKSPLTDR
jgi:hypothetical protein